MKIYIDADGVDFRLVNLIQKGNIAITQDYGLAAMCPSKQTVVLNQDGEFNVADVVLLQKWLLAVPDTHLADWKAADFVSNNRLDVFDLCLMKRELLAKSDK